MPEIPEEDLLAASRLLEDIIDGGYTKRRKDERRY
jgi:hypothetical protein